MHIGVPREVISGETRVALSPEVIKKLVTQGHRVSLEQAAGELAGFADAAYRDAGAAIVQTADAWQAEIIVKVRVPQAAEMPYLRAGMVLIGMLEPYNTEGLAAIVARGVTAFALESAPRTTRAQSLDVLSSQTNVAGYKAVLLAANAYGKFFPTLMMAAGTTRAARVVILGVGVAGLQAIATAKRLGAVIEASDVRPAVKEQIESLGAKYIEVPYETEEEHEAAQGVGGYAKPMPPSWLARQRQEVAKRIAQADIVISTALIPGKPAPLLITEEMVQSMKKGAVIVDMAAGRAADGIAGNCALSEANATVVKHGVTLIGETNLPALLPTDASQLYARNVYDFLKLIIGQEGNLMVNEEDDIVQACLVKK